MSPQGLWAKIQTYWTQPAAVDKQAPQSDVVQLPCCYDLDFGMDLIELSRQHALSVEELIATHCAPIYTVYAIGFSPGFPYLGFVDKRIASPRKGSPRTLVPAGSVGIAADQTGIYPRSTPGGWNIIGRCPQALFTMNDKRPSCALKVGVRIKFKAITRQEFHELEQECP